MGHSSQKMTALYSGQIPLKAVKAAFSKCDLPRSLATKLMFWKMWKMSLLRVLFFLERAMGIEPAAKHG